ncbi:MAG: HAMP domain-containing protein [Planctomycetales bacterium]|nr:HAMP domain-containing protein [Planctomycetales bacterium]
MKRLFLRLYLGVLLILFLAWSIQAYIYRHHSEEEAARFREKAVAGGLRVAQEAYQTASDRQGRLAEINAQFDFPVKRIPYGSLPTASKRRFEQGDRVVQFIDQGQYYFLTRLNIANEVLMFGPMPGLVTSSQLIFATGLGGVLLLAAVAIAMLLRPLARQLRSVERAALAIAGGQLDARIDQGRLKTTTLARAFNRMAERVQALLVEQRELLQAVSHELRTPLTRIRFAVDLIRESPDDCRREERLQLLEAEAHELDDLVRELIYFGQMGANEPRRAVREIRLLPIVKDLLAKQALVFPKLSLQLGSNFERSAISLRIDPTSFERVLGNLLANACRFAHQEVTIEASQTSEGTVIWVDDDGPGIAQHDRTRIFEPFVRCDETRSGTGLGLALVRRIVALHNGRVAASQSPLGGARLEVCWPTETRVGNVHAFNSGQTHPQVVSSSMLRLFVQFFLGVLLILSIAWWMQSIGSRPYSSADSVRLAEQIFGGGARLAREHLESGPIEQTNFRLFELYARFDYPVAIVPMESVLPESQRRFAQGDDIVVAAVGTNLYYGTPMSNRKEVLLFGPLPLLEAPRQIEIMFGLGSILLLAAVAIALLLQPVAKQLHVLEQTAAAIAAGDFSARVVENESKSTLALSKAFNSMAERVESMLRAQREILQAVSHELRVPLVRLHFAIDLILDAKDDQQLEQRLELLESETQSFDELVGDLMRYVRSATSNPCLQMDEVLLLPFMEELIESYAIIHPKIQFCLGEQMGRTDAMLRADRSCLRQVMGSLLSTAARQACSRVVIDSVREASTIRIDIDDDGPGLAESDYERIFQPFVRINRAVDSVGLGLAIAQKIVNQHGGQLTASNGSLGGTRLRLHWPSANANANASANASANAI